MDNFNEKKQKAIQQLRKLFYKFDFELIWKVIKLQDKYSGTLDELKYDLALRMVTGIEGAINGAPCMGIVGGVDYSMYCNQYGEIDIDLYYVVGSEKSRGIGERFVKEQLEDNINYVLGK